MMVPSMKTRFVRFEFKTNSVAAEEEAFCSVQKIELYKKKKSLGYFAIEGKLRQFLRARVMVFFVFFTVIQHLPFPPYHPGSQLFLQSPHDYLIKVVKLLRSVYTRESCWDLRCDLISNIVGFD